LFDKYRFKDYFVLYQDDEDLAVQEEEAEKRDGLQTKVSRFI
jgi:hypothetical protein